MVTYNDCLVNVLTVIILNQIAKIIIINNTAVSYNALPLINRSVDE